MLEGVITGYFCLAPVISTRLTRLHSFRPELRHSRTNRPKQSQYLWRLLLRPLSRALVDFIPFCKVKSTRTRLRWLMIHCGLSIGSFFCFTHFNPEERRRSRNDTELLNCRLKFNYIPQEFLWPPIYFNIRLFLLFSSYPTFFRSHPIYPYRRPYRTQLSFFAW